MIIKFKKRKLNCLWCGKKITATISDIESYLSDRRNIDVNYNIFVKEVKRLMEKYNLLYVFICPFCHNLFQIHVGMKTKQLNKIIKLMNNKLKEKLG